MMVLNGIVHSICLPVAVLHLSSDFEFNLIANICAPYRPFAAFFFEIRANLMSLDQHVGNVVDIDDFSKLQQREAIKHVTINEI